ncbi:MAG: hypothetical protein IKS10_05025 [Lachnospiraceae bacterium]|nr:hypothetical protein [Lachnospiraceae bacterium]
MGERLRDRIFLIVRMIIMIAFSIFGFSKMTKQETGVSVTVLLLVAFFIATMTFLILYSASAENVSGSHHVSGGNGLSSRRFWLGCLALALGAGFLAALIAIGGPAFVLLGYYLAFEALAFFKAPLGLYGVALFLSLIPTPAGFLTQFLLMIMMAACYVQQAFVVEPYRKQVREETILEQGLKSDMASREQAARAELKKNMLAASNQILEERSNLAQALHDKLGHNINGSIYQLEAIKVLMDRDPEKSRQMTQNVIDQLRTGMDEIRAILRKERPEKKDLALLQIYKLCEDCNNKGVETNLETEGDISQINDKLWEVILDNAFEAISNSMKYAKCKNILITITVLNKFVRCVIRDDGIGCLNVKDGMGISGMKMRVRAVNGTLDVSSENGFIVSMLLPCD